MDDKNREIVLRVHLNQAEYAALAKIADAKGIARPAVIREFIRQNTPK